MKEAIIQSILPFMEKCIKYQMHLSTTPPCPGVHPRRLLLPRWEVLPAPGHQLPQPTQQGVQLDPARWPHHPSDLMWPNGDLMWPYVTLFDLMWTYVTLCDHTWIMLTQCDLLWPDVSSWDLVWPDVSLQGCVWPGRPRVPCWRCGRCAGRSGVAATCTSATHRLAVNGTSRNFPVPGEGT